MYYIVEFLETKEIAIAPLCWLNKEKNKCHWPPFKTEMKLTEGMLQAKVPDGEWSICDVKCLHVFGSYAEARNKLADAAIISDFAKKLSDEQEGNKRKKLCIRTDDTDSTSDSEIKYASLLPHSPDISDSVNNSLPTVPVSSASLDLTSTVLPQSVNNSPSDVSSDHISSVDSPEANIIVPDVDLSLNNSEQEKVQLCPCCKLVMREIQELKLQLEMHTNLLSQLLGRNSEKPDCIIRPALPVFIKLLLPVSSVDHLKRLNDHLADESNFTQCCRYFSTLGGNNSKDATRRILQHMISHEVSLQMNWKGRGQKHAFQTYQNVIDLIYRSVVQIPLCHLTTVAETENEIKNWLRFAADRYGGRSKRLPQTSPSQTAT